MWVSTHSHPKVAARLEIVNYDKDPVSTHSHPKVAANLRFSIFFNQLCFNTQPPEGGCL